MSALTEDKLYEKHDQWREWPKLERCLQKLQRWTCDEIKLLIVGPLEFRACQ